MPMPPKLKSVYTRLGWVEKTFIVLLAVYLPLLAFKPLSGWTSLLQFLALAFGFWIVVRMLRIAGRRIIWRLRNRLIVTYLFIAVVPVILIITLASLALYGLTVQVAVYLVTSELDRRIGSLQIIAESIDRSGPASRPDAMRQIAEVMYKDQFPDLEMVLRTPSGIRHYPADSELEPPPRGWQTISGVVMKDGRFHAWSHAKLADGDFTVVEPLSREYLANLVPNLGVVHFLLLKQATPGGSSLALGGRRVQVQSDASGDQSPEQLPPPASRLAIEVRW